MKRIVWCVAIVCVALALGFSAGMSAAAKSYQFTGSVTASDSGTLTVQGRVCQMVEKGEHVIIRL